MEKERFNKILQEVAMELLERAHSNAEAEEAFIKNYRLKTKDITEEGFRLMLRTRLFSAAYYYGMLEIMDEIDYDNLESYVDVSPYLDLEIISDDEGS